MLAPAMIAAIIQAAGPATEFLQSEAAALIDQAVTGVTRPYGDMAFALGLCSARYPLGQSDPYVVKARQEVSDLGIEDLNFALAQIEAISYAEGVEAAGSARTSVRGCADQITAAATGVSQNVPGLRALLTRLGPQ